MPQTAQKARLWVLRSRSGSLLLATTDRAAAYEAQEATDTVSTQDVWIGEDF